MEFSSFPLVDRFDPLYRLILWPGSELLLRINTMRSFLRVFGYLCSFPNPSIFRYDSSNNHADPEWVDRLITIAEASEWPMPLIACAV